GPGSQQALEEFTKLLSVSAPLPLSDELPVDRRKHFDPSHRQGQQVQELERHVQQLVHTADRTRDLFFQSIHSLKPLSLDRFVEQTPKYRRHFWEEVLGKLEDTPLPPRPRSRKIYDKEKWTGYDVVLDVFPDVLAWGVLLVPKDLKPGERRPVVVCQHGRAGVPKDVIEGDQRAYHDFAARLAERGFI